MEYPAKITPLAHGMPRSSRPAVTAPLVQRSAECASKQKGPGGALILIGVCVERFEYLRQYREEPAGPATTSAGPVAAFPARLASEIWT